MNEGSYIVDSIRSRCVEDGDCLLWARKVNKAGAPIAGGSIRRDYWEAAYGPIPAGKLPYPTCGRLTCLSHLELTTRGEVMKATIARPDVAARRHVAAKLRGRAVAKKLDIEKVRQIRASNLLQREKAALFGVAQSLVSRIENNYIWKDGAATVNPFAGLMGART